MLSSVQWLKVHKLFKLQRKSWSRVATDSLSWWCCTCSISHVCFVRPRRGFRPSWMRLGAARCFQVRCRPRPAATNYSTSRRLAVSVDAPRRADFAGRSGRNVGVGVDVARSVRSQAGGGASLRKLSRRLFRGFPDGFERVPGDLPGVPAFTSAPRIFTRAVLIRSGPHLPRLF